MKSSFTLDVIKTQTVNLETKYQSNPSLEMKQDIDKLYAKIEKGNNNLDLIIEKEIVILEADKIIWSVDIYLKASRTKMVRDLENLKMHNEQLSKKLKLEIQQLLT